jgi:hypothetical protein
MKTEAPTWFRRTVADGLKILVALSLPNEPALDLMPATKKLWIHLLWNCGKAWQQQDISRILEAFTRLATRVDRWPAPRQLLESLPPRPQPAAIAAPAVDRAAAKAHIQQIQAMLKGVRSD